MVQHSGAVEKGLATAIGVVLTGDESMYFGICTMTARDRLL